MINASLIRELRMMYQHAKASGLLGRTQAPRVDNYYAMKAAEAQAKAQKASSFKCVPCLRVNPQKANEAVAIVNGQSVCHFHLS
jgi:hypothetical protein